jgi:LPXTG-site transpeptidase (sortase) family protein
LADLSITMSDGLTSVSPGQAVTYTIVALNSGPSAVSNATVTDTMPAALTGVSWTCSASAGSSCTASGSGSINDGAVSLPVGGSVTYTVTGTVASGASGNLSNIATISVPAGVTESDPSDNSAIDTDPIVALDRLPATGFAPGRLTLLSEQPLDSAYSGLGDLLLEIPRLDLQATIVGIPWGDAGWDVTWLWQQVGYLEGTAFPTWPGNTVLTGHVSLPDGSVGPFAGLRDLVWGDEIHIHAWGSQFTYEVRQVRLVSPNSAWPYRHEDLDWVTLVTCQGFDEEHGTYRSRLVIRAVLVDVRPED